MDISISSSNFVKRKEFEALCEIIDEDRKRIKLHNYMHEMHREQINSLGKLIDAQDYCFNKELRNISIAIVDTLPPKYQKQLSDRIVRILQLGHREYGQKAQNIMAELKVNAENLEDKYDFGND